MMSKNESRPKKLLSLPVRALLLMFSVICLLLGILGIFIPGLPTTVFILLSAWAASHCSPKLSAWLQSHSVAGPIITNWQKGGFVTRKAKKAAAISMLICALLMWLIETNFWLMVSAQICMLVVITWLWRRPEPAVK